MKKYFDIREKKHILIFLIIIIFILSFFWHIEKGNAADQPISIERSKRKN